jgi:hypothetical protein
MLISLNLSADRLQWLSLRLCGLGQRMKRRWIRPVQVSAQEPVPLHRRQCLRYDPSAERHQLEEGMTRIQRDERCVRREAG